MGEESRRMGEQSTFSIFLSLLGHSVFCVCYFPPEEGRVVK